MQKKRYFHLVPMHNYMEMKCISKTIILAKFSYVRNQSLQPKIRVWLEYIRYYITNYRSADVTGLLKKHHFAYSVGAQRRCAPTLGLLFL